MADDIRLNPGASGDLTAFDEIVTLNGSTTPVDPNRPKAARSKVGYGVDGEFRDVSVTFPLPVDQPDVSTTGTISAADAVVTAPAGDGALRTGASTTGSVVALLSPGGDAAWVAQLTGTFGGTTVYFEASADSTNGIDGNWTNINGRQTGIVNTVLAGGVTAAGFYRGNSAGARYFRVRAVGGSAIAIAVVLRMGAGTGATFLNASIPGGTNNIGIVSTPGVVSTVNSSTAVLGANVVFTGASEDVLNYAILHINVFASHASATDGLSLQFSADGTNWDHADTFTIPAATGKAFSVQPVARYFRLVYTNGATLQTAFRLQTVFHRTLTKMASQRPSDAYSNENDFFQTWTMVSAFNGTTWDRIRGDIANGLDVDVTRLPAIPAGTNTIGSVSEVPRTSGGCLAYTFLSTAAVQAASVKASAGQVYAMSFFNLGAGAAFVRLYNVAGVPATTDTPVWRGVIPGNTAGAGFTFSIPGGVACTVGIGIRVTGAVADADATALAANAVIGDVIYF